MIPVQHTLLQRGVIHRLRAAGFADFASRVSDAWSRGVPFQWAPAELTGELLEDYRRADTHARPEPTA